MEVDSFFASVGALDDDKRKELEAFLADKGCPLPKRAKLPLGREAAGAGAAEASAAGGGSRAAGGGKAVTTA
eukprot:5193951-Pyramimonas_sp.AAC.1